MSINSKEWEELQQKCYKELAENMPILRKMLNLTQQDLADRVGVTRQTIANIENTGTFKKWSTFLAVMFIFYFQEKSKEYLVGLDIPYAEMKKYFL
ncbi:MAG: helix-turn-helix domain-containing protein [Schaedlerella sp.]|nr:helix-turn-helix domain-containing protein [Schaedlerella sp.]